MGLRELVLPAACWHSRFRRARAAPAGPRDRAADRADRRELPAAGARAPGDRWSGWAGPAVPPPRAVSWFFYLHDYQKERGCSRSSIPERDPLGAAYHAIQSQIAVGSGGLVRQGLPAGLAEPARLPARAADRLRLLGARPRSGGFVGRGASCSALPGPDAARALDRARLEGAFGSYLAVGVVAMFFWAGAINVGMVLGVSAPVVGVPLPFSRPGARRWSRAWIGVGLLMNVSMRRYVF